MLHLQQGALIDGIRCIDLISRFFVSALAAVNNSESFWGFQNVRGDSNRR
jgi:hypothetical protein